MTHRLNFDFEAFYKALSATVSAREISWKTASEQTGVSQSTLSRMSKGRQPDAASLAALSACSGLYPAPHTPNFTRGARWEYLPDINLG